MFFVTVSFFSLGRSKRKKKSTRTNIHSRPKIACFLYWSSQFLRFNWVGSCHLFYCFFYLVIFTWSFFKRNFCFFRKVGNFLEWLKILNKKEQTIEFWFQEIRIYLPCREKKKKKKKVEMLVCVRERFSCPFSVFSDWSCLNRRWLRPGVMNLIYTKFIVITTTWTVYQKP